MGAAMASLAIACVGVGIAAGPVSGVIAGIPSGVLGPGRPSPRRAGRSRRRPRWPSTPPAPLGLLLVALAGAAWLVGVRRRTTRRVPTWTCGIAPEPAFEYTATSYAKLIRLYFGPVLRSGARGLGRAPPGHAVPAHRPLPGRGQPRHRRAPLRAAPSRRRRCRAARPAPPVGQPPALPGVRGRGAHRPPPRGPLMIEPVVLQRLALGLVQAALTLLVAPLLLGITKRVKARLQYRRGPSILQPYRDLAKWWRKESVESDAASPLTGGGAGDRPRRGRRRHAPRPDRRGAAAARRLGRPARRRRAHGARPVRPRPVGARRRQRLRRHGQQPRGRDRDARRAGAPARAGRRRPGGRVDRSGHDRDARARRPGWRGSRRRSSSPPARSRSSPSPRPATSRSTTPTPTSS